MVRLSVPQLDGGLFLSDGGLETTLVYLDGVELRHFAAFVLLSHAAGRNRLRHYYRPYLELAATTPGAGFVLETPTWRASADWGRLLGYDAPALAEANRAAVQLVRDLASEWRLRIDGPMVLSGVIGPRGDGYIATAPGSVADADAYHRPQAAALKAAGVDMLAAVTMTTAAEAAGVARAGASVGLPVAISFTIETDGRLPSGESVREAIEQVDADSPPAYFALNCAHPSHIDACLADGGPWTARIRAIRANASARSHAELDAATDLADRYVRLRSPLSALNVLGGCCGTDARHLRAIRDAWVR